MACSRWLVDRELSRAANVASGAAAAGAAAGLQNRSGLVTPGWVGSTPAPLRLLQNALVRQYDWYDRGSSNLPGLPLETALDRPKLARSGAALACTGRARETREIPHSPRSKCVRGSGAVSPPLSYMRRSSKPARPPSPAGAAPAPMQSPLVCRLTPDFSRAIASILLARRSSFIAGRVH